MALFCFGALNLFHPVISKFQTQMQFEISPIIEISILISSR